MNKFSYQSIVDVKPSSFKNILSAHSHINIIILEKKY